TKATYRAPLWGRKSEVSREVPAGTVIVIPSPPRLMPHNHNQSIGVKMLAKNRPTNAVTVLDVVGNARGFSILQVLITLAVASIISTFAVINIYNSRHSLRLQNSVRQLAGYLEKARLDSIRRHANPVNSSVVFTSPTS